MSPDLRAQVIDQLIGRYGLKRRGEWLRQGKCPACGKRELWTGAEAPWTLRCGRLNKCGWEAASRDLVPDAFARLNERFPASTADPDATADAYMGFVRGLDVARMRGWYRQGAFTHPRGDRRTATVVFDIAPDVTMERLVEPVTIRDPDGGEETRRAHFHGGHKGLWWTPPGQGLAAGDELWIVEGCIDACTLALRGHKVAAILSAGNYPETALATLAALAALGVKPTTLVWALDNDPAGTAAISRHAARATKAGFTCTAALLPGGRDGRARDWNDEHRAGRLTDDDIDAARHRGALLLADSPLEKGLIVWRRTRATAFPVEFDDQTWWWSLSAREFEEALADGAGEDPAARAAATVTRIANCAVDFLYFQRAALTDESWYYVRVRQPAGPAVRNTFAAGQLATASDFKKRLLGIAPGALYSGSTGKLDQILRRGMRRIKTVETVAFQGYSREHKAWIFQDRAIAGGRLYDRNAEDYFEIGAGEGRVSVKSLNSSLGLCFGDAGDYRADWPDLLYRAFGARGIVAAAWWLGSLVVEQIRGLHKSFPFLEIVGEAGAGKSTLIEFLWKTVGRADYEGIDPNKSTLAARARIMTQVANLPVSFIESDRELPDRAHGRGGRFDWDELKTAYNGRASRARGVRTGGTETDEPLFRAAILISQNAPVAASEAILQRIIHLDFDTAGHSAASKRVVDALAGLPVEAVSWWLPKAALAEARVMKTVADRTPVHERAVLATGAVRHVRLARNHAQIMALTEAFADLAGLSHGIRDETLGLLTAMAGTRQAAIAADHDLVVQFWELIDFLGEAAVNHKPAGDAHIALNLNHVYAEAARQHQRLPDIADLKKHLKTSRKPRFAGVRNVRSLNHDFANRTVWCWLFERREGGGPDRPVD